METLNIHQRINSILKLGKSLPKTGKMSGAGGTFAFHETDEVLAFLRPLLAEHGISFYHSVVDHQLENREVEGKHGIRQERQTVKAVQCSLVNIDSPEDRIEAIEYGYGIDSQDKGPGKASSYAVKTFLLNTFMLRGQPNENKISNYEQSISEDQVDRLVELLDETNSDRGKFLAMAGVASLYNIQESKYTTLERLLTDKLKNTTAETPEWVGRLNAALKGCKSAAGVAQVQKRFEKLASTEEKAEKVRSLCKVFATAAGFVEQDEPEVDPTDQSPTVDEEAVLSDLERDLMRRDDSGETVEVIVARYVKAFPQFKTAINLTGSVAVEVA